jgi:Tol biopolymer transport system component
MRTKSIATTAHFLLAAALILFSGAVKQESAKQLFEKAVYLEEAKGDLDKAVEVYKQIVAQFPNERALAAQSLYRAGLCYEKLGMRDAQKAFQNVIEAYPDQTETVRLAKEKLAALVRSKAPAGEAARDFKITKIHTEQRRAGYISPDGRKLALIDYVEENNLWLRDIASGKEILILRSPNEILDCFWSPDSQWIAYLTGNDNICMISAEGGQPKTILEADPEASKAGDYVYPMGWTSDSKKLIFQDTAKGLFAVPASGGNREGIFRFPDLKKAKESDEWLTLSPDGKLIAYQSTQGGNQDIYVMPTKGGEPVRITDDPANDSWPRWSYDGQWLAFNSDRTDRSETWVIRITPDGKAGSQPVQATRGGKDGVWTQDGKIAYSTSNDIEHVFVANIDGSLELQLTRLNNWNVCPRWSPDAKTIAFGSIMGEGRKRKGTIWTVPSNGGDEKFLAYGGSFAWSPDGKTIAFIAETGNPPVKAIISIIPAEGGEARELMNYDGRMSFLDWSPDGRHIAFAYSRGENAINPIPDSRIRYHDIYIIPAIGGQPKRLTQLDAGEWTKRELTSPRWSPDGKKIVFRSLDYERYERGDSQAIGIYTIGVEGGEPKLITDELDSFWLCWTLDGKHIISSRHEKESPRPWTADHRLYKVSAEGGKPEKLSIMGRMQDLSPNGKKIVFTRNTETGTEFWLVENFLPIDTKKK